MFKKFRKFSLVQQLIIVLCFVAVLLFAIMMPLVDYNLRSIIDKQMYESLSNEQELLINGSFMPSYKKSKKAIHIIYDSTTQSVVGSNLIDNSMAESFYYDVFKDGLNQLMLTPNQVSSYHKKEFKHETYYYMVTRIMNSQYFITIQDSDYSNELISSLRNQTIYIQYAFFLLIAVVLIAWVMTLINPLKKIKSYIDVIKERKSGELNLDREDEIGIVSQALVEMNESLIKQEKLREEMIHNISHDLKTPIALIQTYGQSVKDDIYPYGDKNTSMDIILENAQRLEHKVKSFLYLNRLDYLQSENKDQSLFRMDQLLLRVVEQMDALKPEIKLETEIEEVEFIGSEEHWRVAIENIIENASRYAKTLIHIQLRDHYLEIYNDGEHIDEDIIPFLFDPYVKGVKGQFGLGLSISSRIAHLYGYDIRVENKEIGVSFIFEKNCNYTCKDK